MRGIEIAKPDETIIVTSRRRRGGETDENAGQKVVFGSRVFVKPIVGQLAVTEIIANRQALQRQVLEAVGESLDVQGLTIDTLQIKEIDDDNGYIKDLGRAEATASAPWPRRSRSRRSSRGRRQPPRQPSPRVSRSATAASPPRKH